MLFVATTLLGYISYQQLDMEIIPNAELPMLYVHVNCRMDVTPEFMEQEVVIPVESAVAALDNIERIESTAGRRRGSVAVYYEKRTDLKYAYLKLDERITALRADLPEEFTLRVEKVDIETRTNILMLLQTLGEGGVDRVRNFTDQNILPELLNIEGVAALNVYGGQQKSVDIILNREICDAYKITPSRVRSALTRNMERRQYGGIVKEEGLRFFVYLNAEYQDISQIEEIVIGQGRNRVHLRDIAQVYYGEKEAESISRINGKDAVSMQVVNDAQANIIGLSHAVRDRIDALNKRYEQQGIEIIIQEDHAKLMEDNIDQIIDLALIGGLLAVYILWVFLRKIRLVVVVALAIPVSVYTAFNFFFGAGITINSLTLMGIALAVGMLLDTSVVVLENIYRLRATGLPVSESVVQGTREVWRAIVAATLTTVAVFIPFLFSTDYLIRLFGMHIGVSIISTLLVSLVVSLLLIPMVVYLVISGRKASKNQVYREVSLSSRAVRLYLTLLKTAIRNPGPVIIGAVVLFFATILLSVSLSVNRLTELETNKITLYITMSTGTTLERTDEVVAQMEQVLLEELPEQEEIISNIMEEEAMITVMLQEDYRSVGKRSYAEIQSDILERLKDMPVEDIGTSSGAAARVPGGMRGGSGAATGTGGLQRLMGIGEDEEYLVLKGQDFDLMVEVAYDVQTYLEDLDNISSVRLSVRENQPEVHFDLNSQLMAEYGINRGQVGTELSTFQNEIGSGVTFMQGKEEYEIMIKYNEDTEAEGSDEMTIDDLRQLDIPDTEEQSVYELQVLSDIYFARGMREIVRVNQEKQVELRYRYNSDVYDSNELLDYARNEIREVIGSANIPAGIAVELIQEDSGLDEFRYLFILALLLVYMILAALFESFVTPLVLLLSIPFAAIGSFLLLTVTGNSLFNANTMMGFMILLGVVVNNSIILIDFMNILRKMGYRKNRAIMFGGMSRLRPILITAITTIVAMLPLALGQSEYVKAIGPPFAITVIGGLGVSTLLTLVFIPMMYNALEQAVVWLGNVRLLAGILLIVAEISALLLVYMMSWTFIWKMAAVVAFVPGIPLLYWFVSSSLRKSNERIISDADPLHIRVSNLVKIYGRNNKVVRELKSGKRMEEKDISLGRIIGSGIGSLIWQVPLLLFLVWFTSFYLVSSFWQMVSAVLLYLYIIQVLGTFEKHVGQRWLRLFNGFILYGGPLIVVLLFVKQWNNLALTLFTGIFWYILLTVRYISLQLKRDDFEIKKVKKVFRWLVRLIALTPGIGRRREQFKALKGVSLEIGTGMFGLLGPNGAGKSTLIRIICGVLEQSYGKIWINGVDTQLKREELQGLIGYLPQEFGMYENMTAEAYLEYQAMMKELTDVKVRKERIREVLESVHMWDHRQKRIATCSGGMKQRIGIAQVLLHLPRILVVDEPTAGLDPRERIRFRNLLVELSRSRVVIFSTHIIEDISSSCRTMAVINKGKVLFNGTPKEMSEIARGKVWRAYFDAEKFEEQTKEMLVIHHMRDGDRIRARCISAKKPFDDAVEELPLLEDAYLWLLGLENKAN